MASIFLGCWVQRIYSPLSLFLPLEFGFTWGSTRSNRSNLSNGNHVKSAHPKTDSMFAFVTYAQCRVPVSTLFARRKSLLHMESVNCLDLLKIFSHNRKNRTGKKTPYNPSPHCYGRGERPWPKYQSDLASRAECAGRRGPPVPRW